MLLKACNEATQLLGRAILYGSSASRPDIQYSSITNLAVQPGMLYPGLANGASIFLQDTVATTVPPAP